MAELEPGVVVQVRPGFGPLAGRFATVTSVHVWGVKASVLATSKRFGSEYPVRLQTDDFELVGLAVWILTEDGWIRRPETKTIAERLEDGDDERRTRGTVRRDREEDVEAPATLLVYDDEGEVVRPRSDDEGSGGESEAERRERDDR